MKTAPTSPIVAITEGALAAMAAEAARSLDGLETGGILLGTETSDGLVIRHAGDAGPRARRGKGAFHRDLDHARRLANKAWQEDGSQWIGEWHTHPDGGHTPSEVDFQSYLRHLNDPELQFDHFLAVIVGFETGAGVVAVTWIIEKNQMRRVMLVPQTDHSLSERNISTQATRSVDAQTHEREEAP